MYANGSTDADDNDTSQGDSSNHNFKTALNESSMHVKRRGERNERGKKSKHRNSIDEHLAIQKVN